MTCLRVSCSESLSTDFGVVLPLIAVHLFVFYFGILADDTPPVCLAAFAAAAISRADPIKTGIQGFAYDIRTAILPFVFLFNPELLLIGVTSFWHGLVIFCVALLAMICFSSAIQGWMLVRTTIIERVLLLVVVVFFFRPDFVLNQVYPAYAPVDMAKFIAGEDTIEPGRRVRIYITRETNYGDRFKLYVLTAPEAALGLHVSERAVCLDSGCVWGGKLTAMRLQDRKLISVKNKK